MTLDAPTAEFPVRATAVFPPVRASTGVRGTAILLGGVLVLCAGTLLVLGGMRSTVVEPWRWVPAAVVGAAAALVLGALWAVVVRPVVRLHEVVDGRGRELSRTLPRSRFREFDRIAGPLTASGPARPSAVAILTVVLVLVVGGMGAALASVVATTAPPVAGLIGDVRGSTAAAAGEVRHVMQDGLAGVRSVALRTTTTDRTALGAAAAEVLAARPVFRSVQVVDGTGAALAHAGAEPRSGVGTPQPGLREVEPAGATPVVVAVEQLPGSGLAVVAEFDVRALNRVLAATGTATRVVDSGMRSVLGNDGYLAFAPVIDPPLVASIATAQQTGAGSTSESVGGTPSAVAAQRIGQDDESAALGWVAVSHAGLSTVGLAAEPAARASIVVLASAIAAVLLASGWTWHTVLRPLRRLAVHAAAVQATLRSGRAVEPLAVQRLDEIGSVTADLNRRAARAVRDAAAPTTVMRLSPSRSRHARPVALPRPSPRADSAAPPVLARVGRS